MSKRSDLDLVLQDALGKLQAGVPYDQVLAECGEYAADLAPLLQAAQWMRQSAQTTVPRAAMVRSRARFLRAADERAARALPLLTRFRWAFNSAVILLVVAAALFFTGLSSVSALPGQALYPVKRAVERAQLALAGSNPAGKLVLEESFDQRRVDEVVLLAEHAGGQRVSFAGFLSGGGVEPYNVEGILLDLNAEQLATVQELVGSYVEVQGQMQASGRVQVSVLRLRFFDLEGTLAQRDGDTWQINGVWVLISQQTRVDLPPAVGQVVEITAIRLAQQDFMALTVRLQESLDPTRTENIPQGAVATEVEDPTETPREAISASETAGREEEIHETPQPGGAPESTSEHESATRSDASGTAEHGDGDHEQTQQATPTPTPTPTAEEHGGGD